MNYDGYNKKTSQKLVLLERDHARDELSKYVRFVPPGHFHSPIPSLDEVRIRESLSSLEAVTYTYHMYKL